MTTPDKEEMPTDRTAGRFRKKPVVINAAQWFRNGDHPEDSASEMFDYPDGCQRPRVIREGKIVRYYRHPKGDGSLLCSHSDCKKPMRDHGWIDTLEGGHIVCPGDYVITGVKGEHYPCKPDIFAETYEPAALSTLPVNDRRDQFLGALAEQIEQRVKTDLAKIYRPSADDETRAWKAAIIDIVGASRQTSDDAGRLREELAQAETYGDDMRRRLREAENALHQFNYPPDPKMLRAIADEIDCGQDCPFGHTEWDTNAHVCSKADTEGCAGDNAIELREFADAIEARAAIKGVPQPATTPFSGDLFEAHRLADQLLTMSARRSTETQFGWTHPDCTNLQEAARILKNEPQRAQPEYVDAVLSDAPASEAGKLSTDEVRA